MTADHNAKLQVEFEKLGKLLDSPKGPATVHVVASHERNLHKIEATVHYHHHDLVGHGSSEDLLAALHQATDKLEAQAIRLKEKWRESKRGAITSEGESN